MRLVRNILAVVAGVVAGGCIVAAVESISSLVYPPPKDLDFSNRTAMSQFVAGLPLGAFLLVLAAWSAGNFAAGYLARRWTPARMLWPALIACGLLLLAALINLALIPHPLWFWFAGIAVSIAFAAIGIAVASPREFRISASRSIAATRERVFQAISQVDSFAHVVPGIDKIEVLTPQRSGLGTRFRETRTIRGHTAATELTVTGFEPNRSIQLDSHMCGATWSTLFSLDSRENCTGLRMDSVTIPHTLGAKLVVPLMIGMVHKALEDDLDAIQRYCEQPAPT